MEHTLSYSLLLPSQIALAQRLVFEFPYTRLDTMRALPITHPLLGSVYENVSITLASVADDSLSIASFRHSVRAIDAALRSYSGG